LAGFLCFDQAPVGVDEPTAPYSRLVAAAAEAEVLDGQNGAADTRAAQVGDHLAANAWA
jgi:hypothetical protein